MRSMFLKIFFWFWGAMLLMVLTFFLSANLLSTGYIYGEGRKNILSRLEKSGIMAAEIYENRGLAPLNLYLGRVRAKTGASLQLYTASGKKLAGRGAVIHRARIKRLSRKQEGTARILRRRPFFAKPIETRSGKRFVVLSVSPKGPMAILFNTSGKNIVRLFAVALVSGLVCFLLAKSLTTPLGRLKKAVTSFAKGDLSVRVGDDIGKKQGEISMLAQDFDHMAGQIEALVQNRDRLLRDMSHELRSPLARLAISVELARKKPEPEVHDCLDRIDREVERIDRLIGRMLELSRMNFTESLARTEKIDVREMVREIAGNAKVEADRKGLHLRLTESSGGFVSGDREYLTSAVENIVRNALRYSPENSEVEIGLTRDQGLIIISVRDHGPGVPRQDLEKLFHPFFQVEGERGHDKGGTGIGLAIAQRAVSLHKGTVRAVNHPEKGLYVTLKIPEA